MSEFTEYNTATGKIYGVHSGYDTAEQAMAQVFMPEVDGIVIGRYLQDTHYILDGQPTERPSSPVTLSDLTLMDVPAGSTLWINAERYENVEGDIELEFPLPGIYRLRVECWPYRDWEGEVTA